MIKKISMLLLFGVVLAVSCGKDGDEEVLVAQSSEKQMTSFKFLASDNEALSVDVTGDILPDNTVEVGVPFGTPLTALVPTIGFTAGATIDPQAAETDFSSEVTYTVTAADESTAEYTVKVAVGQNSEKQMTSFKFLASDNEALEVDVTGDILPDNTVEVGVPFGTPLTALVPTIGFTAGATIDPQAAETDFSSEVTYTVTAADESTAEYTVKVAVGQNSEKQMTSFKFLASDNQGALEVDVTGDILPDNTVEVEVPFGTPLTALVPTIGFTAGATIDPQAAATDFSGDVAYTITAADGSAAGYTVKVSEQAQTDRQVLEDIFRSNPGNTIGDSWQVDDPDSDIGTWRGVTVDEDGRVVQLSFFDQDNGEGFGNLSVLPASIGNLTALTLLDLNNNSLTSLPAEIGNLTALTLLDLNNNSLTSLPAEIGNLAQLTELRLSSNNLTSVPAEIGNLAQLTRLDLTGNDLTSLPAEIGNLVQLTSLSLHGNDLTSLPAEIGNLAQLTRLDLLSNDLASLPAEIGNLAQLTELRLSSNNLTSVPAEIGNLAQLTELDLSFNDLTAIPAEIGNLTQLTFLNLNGNDLTSLPAEIGNLIQLTFLNLRDNDLTSLPAEIGNLVQLTFLNLKGNDLTSIPQAVCDLATEHGTNITKDTGVACQ